MANGKIFLIGAGPGAADLITLRGHRALQSADAILIDRLIPKSMLDELGISTADKQIEWLADQVPRWPQSKINAWIAGQSLRGKKVARLKGGDPFVFGQAESEVGHFVKLGLPWEVIPGASSFTAVLTAAGFPLTRRHQGRSFSVATAKLAGGSVATHFPKSDSLVVMMGVDALEQTVTQLFTDGWSTNTPCAIIERGTMTWERRVSSRLDRLATDAKNANVSSPACIVIGSAATPVYDSRSCPTILFTGLDPTNFRTLGNLIHWPALEIIPNAIEQDLLPSILFSLHHREFKLIIFAGKAGVTSFFRELDRHHLDSRLFSGTKIFAIGTETAGRLREHGVRADVVVESKEVSQTLGVLNGFRDESALVVEGTHGLRCLYEGLMDYNINVSTLALNQIIPNRQLGQALPPHDAIFFVSPSGVRAYHDVYGTSAFQKQVWCLGKETQDEAMKHNAQASIWGSHELTLSEEVAIA